MKAIAAVDANNGIGNNGKLLFRIPEDMAFFKEATYDKIVVMGRKTFESIGSKPLPCRTNIVITSNPKLIDRNDVIAGTAEEFDNFVKIFYDHNYFFIIGGASVYNKYIDQCDEVYLTRYNRSFEADTYFPNLEEHGFHEETIIKQGEYEGYPYTISRWVKRDTL